MNIKSTARKILADLHTPVSVFLKARAHFSQVLLLESSDFSNRTDSYSFVCFESLSSFIVTDAEADTTDVVERFERFLGDFEMDYGEYTEPFNGVFGFCTYDAVTTFERIDLRNRSSDIDMPLLRYDFYRFVLVFDHYFSTLYLIENRPDNDDSRLDEMERLLARPDHDTFAFSRYGTEDASMTDARFLEIVEAAKRHCQRGDIFQVVLSRRYRQAYRGDDFNVYRALRSVNPSPYLFYFDYSSYRIFGSSPEAQIKIHGKRVEIHPIAGTFRRTGDAQKDAAEADRLRADPKENAEHTMLVDLARNDLSRHANAVKINQYKTTEYFSHVIHLVSKVEGQRKNGTSAFRVFADAFPAGTLSGAPKYRAMQLIDQYEAERRSFYGGSIGWIHLNGDLNHAITIRSFLSQNNVLHFQAGAGIVIDSVAEKERDEVSNKLAALRLAMDMAEKLV